MIAGFANFVARNRFPEEPRSEWYWDLDQYPRLRILLIQVFRFMPGSAAARRSR
jgi:hypothetical protein